MSLRALLRLGVADFLRCSDRRDDGVRDSDVRGLLADCCDARGS